MFIHRIRVTSIKASCPGMNIRSKPQTFFWIAPGKLEAMAYGPTECFIVCIIFSVMVWVFLLLRFYVRIFLQKGPYVDDIFAFLATVCQGQPD